MEEKRSRVVKTKSNVEKVENTQIDTNRCVWGWNSAAAVAEEIWRNGCQEMLRGKLLFAYKNTDSAKPGLFQIVVVQNPLFIYEENEPEKGHYSNLPGDTFGINIVTSGYSAIIPKVPIEYLETEVVSDLTSYKVNPNILATYKQIIETIKEELKL